MLITFHLIDKSKVSIDLKVDDLKTAIALARSVDYIEYDFGAINTKHIVKITG